MKILGRINDQISDQIERMNCKKVNLESSSNENFSKKEFYMFDIFVFSSKNLFKNHFDSNLYSTTATTVTSNITPLDSGCSNTTNNLSNNIGTTLSELNKKSDIAVFRLICRNHYNEIDKDSDNNIKINNESHNQITSDYICEYNNCPHCFVLFGNKKQVVLIPSKQLTKSDKYIWKLNLENGRNNINSMYGYFFQRCRIGLQLTFVIDVMFKWNNCIARNSKQCSQSNFQKFFIQNLIASIPTTNV